MAFLPLSVYQSIHFPETMNQRLLTKEAGCSSWSGGRESLDGCNPLHLDQDLLCARREPRDPTPGVWKCPQALWAAGDTHVRCQGAASRALLGTKVSNQGPCAVYASRDVDRTVLRHGNQFMLRKSGLLKRKSGVACHSPSVSAVPPPSRSSGTLECRGRGAGDSRAEEQRNQREAEEGSGRGRKKTGRENWVSFLPEASSPSWGLGAKPSSSLENGTGGHCLGPKTIRVVGEKKNLRVLGVWGWKKDSVGRREKRRRKHPCFVLFLCFCCFLYGAQKGMSRYSGLGSIQHLMETREHFFLWNKFGSTASFSTSSVLLLPQFIFWYPITTASLI